jgi:hypothetical protein
MCSRMSNKNNARNYISATEIAEKPIADDVFFLMSSLRIK